MVGNIDLATGDADVDGSPKLDGVSAATFTGRLDDADDDGVPGENVTLSYSDKSTESLEDLLNRLDELP